MDFFNISEIELYSWEEQELKELNGLEKLTDDIYQSYLKKKETILSM